MNTRIRLAAVAALASLLTACGLAETGAVAAAQGESAADQAEEAKKTQVRIEKQIDDAQQAAMDARARAESASE
jgi:cell division protein FtsX